jgi:hypothetical protein
MYVCADGPRGGLEGEADRCREVRAIATAVDWPCETRTLFRERNLGCKASVSQGIGWFFEHEPEGIILEDDTLPSPAFFEYCDRLLEKYREMKSVRAISGSYFGDSARTAAEYYYSIYSMMWGWATWRNRWADYRLDVGDYPSILRHMRRGIVWNTYFDSLFSKLHRGEIDTWDYQWILSVWRERGVVCRPKRNLVRNLGYGPDATHTRHEQHPLLSKLAFGQIDPERLSSHSPDRDSFPDEDRLDEAVWLHIGWKSTLIQRFPALYEMYGKVRDRMRRRRVTADV